MEYRPLADFVELSQGLAVNKGTAHLFSDIKNCEFPYPLLRIVDFEKGIHDFYSKYVSKDVSPSVIIDENTIVFTRVTCQCFRGFKGVLHNNLFIVNLISSELTKDYLFTVLQSDFVRRQALYFAQSSVVPDLNHMMFKEIRIPVPNKSIQEKIANLYLNITNKIDNNNIINHELESMARTIYDYWFLQFDFPDENGKPYKSSGGKMVWNEELKCEIPDGWETDEIGNLMESKRGISYNSATIGVEGVPMINLASFNTNGTYKPSGIKTYSGVYEQDKVLKPYDLLMCNTQQTAIDFKKDIIGKAILVPDIFEGDIVSSHHVTAIKTHTDEMKYYLYYLFNTEFFHKYIAGYTNGTNILGLLFDGVEKYKITIPSKNVLKKYANIAKDIEKQKSKIIKENQELTSLRDFLLPLLMSGQVGFKEC